MRVPHDTTTSANGSPLLRLTSPTATAAPGREGYAAAETIMRSAVHAKKIERREPTASATRPAAGH